MEVLEFLWHCLRNSEIAKFYILQVSRDLEGIAQIIKEMVDFLKIFLGPKQCQKCV